MKYLGMVVVVLMVGVAAAYITDALDLPTFVAGLIGSVAMLVTADLYLRFRAKRGGV